MDEISMRESVLYRSLKSRELERGLINLYPAPHLFVFPFPFISGPPNLAIASRLGHGYRYLLRDNMTGPNVHIPYSKLLIVYHHKEVVRHFLEYCGEHLEHFIPVIPIKYWIDGLPTDLYKYQQLFRYLEENEVRDLDLEHRLTHAYRIFQDVECWTDEDEENYLDEDLNGWFRTFYYYQEDDNDTEIVSLFGYMPNRGWDDYEDGTETMTWIYFNVISKIVWAAKQIIEYGQLKKVELLPMRILDMLAINLHIWERVRILLGGANNAFFREIETACWYILRHGFSPHPNH